MELKAIELLANYYVVARDLMANQKRLIKGAAGATGGALMGGIFGAISGAAGGAMQFGIPLGIIVGLVSVATGNGFAGFVGALISTTFSIGLICGVFGGLIYAIGGGVAGSTWGEKDK